MDINIGKEIDEKQEIDKLKDELRMKARRSCKLCYGRGYIGIFEGSNHLQFCRCVFRKRENERKSEEKS